MMSHIKPRHVVTTCYLKLFGISPHEALSSLPLSPYISLLLQKTNNSQSTQLPLFSSPLLSAYQKISISNPFDKLSSIPAWKLQMGLSNHVAPSDGILILLVANTALSVSLLRDLIVSFLCLFTSRLSSSQPDAVADAELSFRDRFFDRFEPVRFGSAKRGSDCCVCLNRFEPESVVSWLNCGHLLHKGCLETWMEYQHATCPLCRAHLLPGEEN